MGIKNRGRKTYLCKRIYLKRLPQFKQINSSTAYPLLAFFTTFSFY
nr:MAG TPA: hypothetical protein [Bacteriophage sp.]